MKGRHACLQAIAGRVFCVDLGSRACVHWDTGPRPHGWLHPGDMATLTGGMVRIVDRAKDMINRGGENVYSVEVENALCAHPDVIEVAVVGVPDPVMGEKVGAVVLPRAGVSRESLVPSLISYARENLADFKVPQFVRVLDDPLPRNAGGKVVKAPLRADDDWIAVPR